MSMLNSASLAGGRQSNKLLIFVESSWRIKSKTWYSTFMSLASSLLVVAVAALVVVVGVEVEALTALVVAAATMACSTLSLSYRAGTMISQK